MRDSSKQHFLSVFIVLALAMAGISPACHFISGKSGSEFLLDICYPDGVKTLRIDGVTGEITSESKKEVKREACSFCFSSSNIKLAPSDIATIYFDDSSKKRAKPFVSYDNIYGSLSHIFHLPRAPPSLFV